MNKLVKLGMMFLLQILFVWSSTVAQSDTVDQRLLISSRNVNESNAVYFTLVDTDGTQEPFASTPVDGRQVYISPNATAISARGTSGDLLVLDNTGHPIFEYDFSTDEEQVWTEWYVWGWSDDRTLVLSHAVQGRLLFYAADVYANQDELRLLEDLNASPVIRVLQDVDGIEREYGSPISFIVKFSPRFDFLLTPASIVDGTNPQSSPDDVLVWDLNSDSGMPITVIDRTLPWWYQVTSSTPAWSLTGDDLLFVGFADNDNDERLALYLYEDFGTAPAVVAPVNCLEVLCDPNQISWSPDHESAAYWLTPFPRSESNTPSQLISVDIASGGQNVILETAQWNAPLFWSLDSEYLAFQEATPSDDGSDISSVRLVNMETGEINMSVETQQTVQIFGWLNTSDLEM